MDDIVWEIAKIEPLFRWAGGKTKYVKHLEQHLVKSDIYVEPFFGGGAIFCHMYNKQLAQRYIINDVKTELIDLYKSIKNNVEDVIYVSTTLEKEYLKIPVSDKQVRKDYYYKKRKEYWLNPTSGLLFFLLKTCFNGIWQSMKEANGLFATPCGLLKETKPFIDVNQLRNWSKALQNAEIYCGDFNKIPLLPNSLIYCDPPYRDSFTTYSEIFGDNDQKRCVEWCIEQSKKGARVVFSNKSDGKFFEELTKDTGDIFPFDATHTAGRRKKETTTDIDSEGKESETVTFSALKVKEIIIVFPKKNV